MAGRHPWLHAIHTPPTSTRPQESLTYLFELHLHRQPRFEDPFSAKAPAQRVSLLITSDMRFHERSLPVRITLTHLHQGMIITAGLASDDHFSSDRVSQLWQLEMNRDGGHHRDYHRHMSAGFNVEAVTLPLRLYKSR